jgi:RNA polymerase sigma-70 factor (ECF subfamily)
MPIEDPESRTPDRVLLTRMAAGDDRALAELYDRHGRLTFSLACALLGDRADAEEVAADTFLQAWRSAGRFDPRRGSVTTWLAMMARSRALDLLRARGRGSQALERARASGATGPELVPTDSPEGIADRLRIQDRVRRALSDLPEAQRRVIELAYFGGLSQSEIAATLNEPLGTVKTRTRAAMDKLRQALGPYLTER